MVIENIDTSVALATMFGPWLYVGFTYCTEMLQSCDYRFSN